METHGKTFSCLLVSICLSLLLSGAVPCCRGQGTLRGYLPEDNAAAGWTKDGEPQEYEGEDLYTYIDGGAEIYQEYGFRRVILQDYENAKGNSVSLEIFEMDSPAAAFGMFTFKRSGKGRTAALGMGAELEAYYLNFWKGRFLVTLTGFDEAPETIDGLTAVAAIVDSKIRDAGGGAPGLVGALPEWGLKSGSIKYFKGLLGLNNIYSFHTARGLGFIDGVKAVYENGATLIVLDYGTEPSLIEARGELGAYLKGSDRFAKIDGEWTDILIIVDDKKQYIAFSDSMTCLYIGIGAVTDAALDIIRRATQ